MRPWIFLSAGMFLVSCGDSTPPSRPGAGGSAASTGSGPGGTGGAGDPTGPGGSAGAGGSTGGSGGTTGGSGGSDPPDASTVDAPLVDASKPDVVFTWPETVPGLKCKPGRYQGTFTGTYASSAAVIPLPVPVAGDIDLTLVQSASGEILEITNGKLSGMANLVFPFSAELVGKLNCKTSKLDPSTALKNGTYIVLGVSFSFEGPFLADYDKVAPAFVNGTWDVKEPNPLYGGSGAWSANFVSGPSDSGIGDVHSADMDEGGQ